MTQTAPTPTALTVAQTAKVLSAAGGRRVTEAMILADLAAGAPTNADGTVNLVHYTAWLAAAAGPDGPPVREEVNRGD